MQYQIEPNVYISKNNVLIFLSLHDSLPLCKQRITVKVVLLNMPNLLRNKRLCHRQPHLQMQSVQTAFKLQQQYYGCLESLKKKSRMKFQNFKCGKRNLNKISKSKNNQKLKNFKINFRFRKYESTWQ